MIVLPDLGEPSDGMISVGVGTLVEITGGSPGAGLTKAHGQDEFALGGVGQELCITSGCVGRMG